MSRINKNGSVTTYIPATIHQGKINFESSPFIKTQRTSYIELKRLKDEDRKLLKTHPEWKACEGRADEMMKEDFRKTPSTRDMRR